MFHKNTEEGACAVDSPTNKQRRDADILNKQQQQNAVQPKIQTMDTTKNQQEMRT